MSSYPLDLSGLTDKLIRSIAQDLNVATRICSDHAKASGDDNDEMRLLRQAVVAFASGHPQAERTTAVVILKHIGFSTSLLRDRRVHPVTSPMGSSFLGMKEQRQGEEKSIKNNDVIIPAFSPVPWLKDSSWEAMTREERLDFLETACLLPPIFQEAPAPFLQQEEHDRVVMGTGPRRILILVGVHGNEPCGVHAVREILSRFSLFDGCGLDSQEARTSRDLDSDKYWKTPLSTLYDELTIEFVLGNPRAYAEKKRFLKKNLNRMFDIHTLCDDDLAHEQGYQYELQRARILEESIRHSDFVFDCHSCSADVAPFALPNSMEVSEEFAERLPVSYVIKSLAHMTEEGGTTLDAARLYNIPAVCVECGQHDHPDAVARAASVISACLRLQYDDCLEGTQLEVTPCRFGVPPTVMKCVVVERVNPGFQWLQEFPEFHFVPGGSPALFRDDVQGDVSCPIDDGAYIVMPTAQPLLGEEALFWAIPG